VAAVGLGAAAVGAMAGYAAGQYNAPSSTTYYPSANTSNGGLPCTPNTVVIQGVTYYRCGSSWYTQAYGSNGPIYTPVPPPPGY
jgi:hypothetical protein